ncbi:hypothetical protein GEMRC1_002125 [Eukaryota sp. GEM-RC1]
MRLRRSSVPRKTSNALPPHLRHDADLDIDLFPESMFYHTRFRRPLTLQHLVFFLYLPFGVLLCVLRILFILLGSLFLFDMSKFFKCDSVFFKVFSFVLGVRVRVDNPELLNDADYRIIVSNHICEADALAIASAMGKVSLIVPAWYSKFILTRKLTNLYYNPIFIQPKSSRHILHETVTSHLRNDRPSSHLPILLHPEGALTNGKIALMSFNKFMFGLNVPIKPVAIRCRGSFHSVLNLDHLTTPVSYNIIWLLILPSVSWRITYLPTQTCGADEDSLAFSKRVQGLIADQLGLDCSDYHVKQKYSLVLKHIKLRSVSFDTKEEDFGWSFSWFYSWKVRISSRRRRKRDRSPRIRGFLKRWK